MAVIGARIIAAGNAVVGSGRSLCVLTGLSNEWLVASAAQCVLWQKQCDRLLDHMLCNYCNDAKDEAFTRGQGLDWIPDNCCQCRHVRRIFEQTVTYREWQEPLMYADDEPHTMWAWNPLSHPKHCF